MDDLTLAQRIAAREPRALDELVELHHSAIFRFLVQLTRHREDAEDLAQQTLMRAIRGASRFDGRGSLRAWLLGIAFREFTKHRRRRVWLPLLSEAISTSRDFESVNDSEALLAALARLKPDRRAIFLMHHVEEVSVLEIAEALQIPEGTVKSRLHTARQQLQSYLATGETNYVTEAC